MTHKRLIVHLILFLLSQWSSLLVIILNSVALSKTTDQSIIQGTQYGPHDMIFILLASVSLFILSVLFCFYIHHYTRLKSNRMSIYYRFILWMEIIVSVCMIGLWIPATILVFDLFRKSPFCHWFNQCHYIQSIITLAFVCTFLWCLLLVISIYSLIYRPVHSIHSVSPTNKFEIHPTHHQPKMDVIMANSMLSKFIDEFSVTTHTPSVVSVPSLSHFRLTDFEFNFEPIRFDSLFHERK